MLIAHNVTTNLKRSSNADLSWSYRHADLQLLAFTSFKEIYRMGSTAIWSVLAVDLFPFWSVIFISEIRPL